MRLWIKKAMGNTAKNKIRDLREGNWYWINRDVLYTYGRKLKASGIAVYNALVSFANPKTQSCFPTQKVLAEITGLSRRTVLRKIKLLKELGLVKVERKRGSCVYHLLEADVTEKAQPCDKNDTSCVIKDHTNNNKLTRININNNVSKKILNFSSKGFAPKPKEELLALDLADELNDRKNLSLYLHYARCYPESFLRRVLGEVKEIPIERIKKSKAALFTYLVKKYAKNKRAS